MATALFDGALDAIAGSLGPRGPAVGNAVTSYAPSDFSIHLFLQLAVIPLTCRTAGWLGQKLLGQTQVVGEMIAVCRRHMVRKAEGAFDFAGTGATRG